MKKSILLFILISCFFSIPLQAQQDTFSIVLYSPEGEGIQAYSAVPASDNGYLLAGTIEDDYREIGLVIKVDTNGNILWSKAFDNTDSDTYPSFIIRSIINTYDSCYLISGGAKNITTDKQDAVCIKIDATGNLLWSSVFTYGDGYLNPTAVCQSSDSGYVVTGYTHEISATGPSERTFIAKLDADGDIQWVRILLSGDSSNKGLAIKPTSDNNYIITGRYGSEAFLLKLTTEGYFLWAKRYDVDEPYCTCEGVDVINTEAGFLTYLSMNNNITLMETDSAGNIIWSKSYKNYSEWNRSVKIHKTTDNAYILVYNDWQSDGLLKVDTAGNLIWAQATLLIGFDVIETATEGFFVAGNGPKIVAYPKSESQVPTIGLIQTDSLGNAHSCVVPVALDQADVTLLSDTIIFSYNTNATESTIPLDIYSVELLSKAGCINLIASGGGVTEYSSDNVSIYPNPGRGNYTLSLADVLNGELIVYNSQGKEIRRYKFYSNQLTFDLAEAPAGIYFYQIVSAGKHFADGKLIIEE